MFQAESDSTKIYAITMKLYELNPRYFSKVMIEFVYCLWCLLGFDRTG